MIKRLSLLAQLFFVLCYSVAAQQLGTWRLYMSYRIATKSDVSGSTVYSLMNGNLLSYDLEDGEVRTYERLNPLSDVGIAYIAYSKAADRLLIVYSNSNVDLLGADGTVVNLPSLRDTRRIGKEVSSVCVGGTMAYLATGFGIVEVDMKAGTFGNTYKLDFDIKSIAASDEGVFVALGDGVYCCRRSDNMFLKENWKLRHSSSSVQGLACFQDKLLMNVLNNGIYVLDPFGTAMTKYAEGKYTYMRTSGGRLFFGSTSRVGYSADLGATPTVINFSGSWSDVTYAGGRFWMSDQENGLRAYKEDGGSLVLTGEVIQTSSPIRDLGYRVSWIGDRLLVAGGVNTVSGFNHPATSMYYENGEWTNFQEMEIPAEYPRFKLINTTDLVQDPLDATRHFASLYRGGLCEYKDGKFVRHYNKDNSPLRSLMPSLSQSYNYMMCSALSCDADGNFWMASSQMDTALHVMRPDGTWLNLYYKELDAVSLIDQILHHSSGMKFVISRRVETKGIFCLDMNGTEKTSDDKTIMHQTITNQDGTSYQPDEFYCLCEDLDARVWVGTSAGLFVIDDASQVFSPDYQFTQVKINRNDGSGLADYLLSDVTISCIAVDAANRKWVGTPANGVFLISADGQQMLHHFTEEDSPLLSNYVQSIAVNASTGEVVFGTDKGLCSYIGDATAPESELSKDNVTVFPNPVTPDYNGPIAIRGLVNNCEVKIISTGGQLVWNGVSAGGTCTWNGLANNGRRVASGLYHVVANTPEGNKAIVTRIVIVR